jgi:hypothetical protein
MKKKLLLAAALVFCATLPIWSATACEAPEWTICGTASGCAEGCNGGAGKAMVSLEVHNVTADELGRALSDFSGKSITLGVADQAERFTLDVKNMPLDLLLDQLAAYGAVVERASATAAPAAKLPEANVSLKLERVPAGELAKMFDGFLDGSGYALEASEPAQLVSLEVKNMPLRELLPLLASAASVRLRSV